jgi:hypothetical protein
MQALYQHASLLYIERRAVNPLGKEVTKNGKETRYLYDERAGIVLLVGTDTLGVQIGGQHIQNPNTKRHGGGVGFRCDEIPATLPIE